MRVWNVCVTVIFILLLSFPQPLMSQKVPGKSLQIGLMKFSRLVFDEEKTRLGEQFEHLEEIIQNRLTIKHYFQKEEISYAEIEDPANVIDNSMVRDTLKKLEKLCGAKNLDGIIFGHFQQENKMIFVFRFYYSETYAKKRNISEKERIKSFSKKMQVKKLAPEKVKKETDKLINKLVQLIDRKKRITQPTPSVPKVKKVKLETQRKKEVKVEKKELKKPVVKQVPPKPLNPIYAAQLEFIDAAPHSQPGQADAVKMIYDAVADAIRKELTEIQQKWNKKVILNQDGHNIPNTVQNAERIIRTVYDSNIDRENKIKTIIDTQMIPHNVDIIVCGQYVFNASHSAITIRPIVILRSSKKMLVKNLLFKKDELLGSDKDGKPVLCKGALEQITLKVKEYLEELHR